MTNRRDFFKALTGLTSGLMLPYHSVSGIRANKSDKWGELLPQRILGKSEEAVTMLGVGGFHIGGSMDEQEAQRTIEVAMEGGIRFFDTAESYQNGESERRYGKYLVPQYRDEVFLMTKSTARDRESAREHLEGSLRRMGTDQLDLWQVHSLTSPDDTDARIDNGIVDFFQEALNSGKVRYIGFTGHASPDAQVRMMERQDIFHTVQMPVNPVDAAANDSFLQKVAPIATERNIGLLAMKTLADGRFFEEKEQVGWQTDNPVIPDHITIKDSLYFAWSLPISVLITGPDHADMLREKMRLARDFTKLDKTQREEIVSRVQQFAEGPVEYYKS